MNCVYSSTVGDAVQWKNGSTALMAGSLAGETADRARIDTSNNLIIERALLVDDGKYTCSWNNITKIQYTLIGKSREKCHYKCDMLLWHYPK